MDSPHLSLQALGVPPASSFNLESFRSASAIPAPDKLQEVRKSANEFESSLLAAWLKEMEGTVHAFSGTTPDSSAEGFSDLGAQALASGIVARGGLGIAKLLINSMVPPAAHSGTTVQKKD